MQTETLIAIIAVLTLPAAGLAAILFGGTAAAAIALVGWFVLVPVLAILEDEEGLDIEFQWNDAETTTASGDPLDTLRDRYARGEVDDEEFETRLERLLETEDVELPPSATRERELEL